MGVALGRRLGSACVAPSWREHAARRAEIVVDLNRISSIDFSGLGALVDLHNRLPQDDRRLAVVAPAGTAAAVHLNLSGLHTRMPVYRTREAALAAADAGTHHAVGDRQRPTEASAARRAGQDPGRPARKAA